jgi:ribose 5-phosphate isomerase B
MRLVIGADHAGFEAKERLKKFLQKLGHDVTDFGCYSTEPVDFPDIALLVSEAVRRKEFDRAVLVDGFNGAMPLAANKVHGIRAVAAYDTISARFAAAHEDCNVLCLGGKTHGELALEEMIKVWLNTPFEGGKYQKRLDKITAIEQSCQ